MSSKKRKLKHITEGEFFSAISVTIDDLVARAEEYHRQVDRAKGLLQDVVFHQNLGFGVHFYRHYEFDEKTGLYLPTDVSYQVYKKEAGFR